MTQLLVLLLAGCNPGPINAPYGYSLNLPVDLTFGMDAGFVAPGDGIGMLAMGDVGVWDADGYPANGIKVEILSGWYGAYIIPEEAVTILTSFEEGCATAATDDICHAYFDPENGTYVEFTGNYESINEFHPNYYSGATDHNGVLRFYVLVDSVPIDQDGSPVSVPIYITITNAGDAWTLNPIGSNG